MITVTIFKNENQFSRIESVGHAGYADYGQDIICSAVSVLLINTLNSIEKFTTDKVEVSSMDSGELICDFPEGLSHDGMLLMDSLILGLQEISKEYGKNHLTLIFKEV